MQAAAPITAGRGGRRGALALAQSRPRAYIFLVMVALLFGFALHERIDGIFSCPAGGYAAGPGAAGNGSYLANCQARSYGDYDHGAFWFGLEPRAREHAEDADVLFLGSSRLQFGFSAPSTDRWLTERSVSYYLLGFAQAETSRFTGPLLARMKPRARAYVIDVSNFFRPDVSPVGNEVMTDPNVLLRLLGKGAWQPVHRAVCTASPLLCGTERGIYRTIETGQWRNLGKAVFSHEPPGNVAVDPAHVEQMQAEAERLVAGLGVDRSCVIMTYVWTPANDRANAAAMAERMGVPFVSPQLEGLATFDGNHLDPPSAERFSQAFFTDAEPYLARCLGARRVD